MHMTPRFSQLLVLAVAAVSSVQAANNPPDYKCKGNDCVVHTARSEGYSMTVWGKRDVLGDLTDDADWIVLNCDKDSHNQEIRIVCKSDDSTKCKYLEQGGAVHKIVKLPENCGREPFARISKLDVAQDQDIPGHVAPKLSRRQTQPLVLAATIDHKINEIREDKGDVFFMLDSMNIPHAPEAEIQKRQNPLRDGYKKWSAEQPEYPKVEGSAKLKPKNPFVAGYEKWSAEQPEYPKVEGSAKLKPKNPFVAGYEKWSAEQPEYPKVEGSAKLKPENPFVVGYEKWSGEQRKDLAQLVEEGFTKLRDRAVAFKNSAVQIIKTGEFNGTIGDYSKPIKFDKAAVTLVEPTITCGKLDVTFKAAVEGSADLKVTVGAIVIGRIKPSVQIDHVSLYLDMDGQVDGTFSMTGSLSSSLDSGDKYLPLEISLANLVFPPSLGVSIGPTIKFAARLKGTVELSGKFDYTHSYSVKNVQMYFPQTKVFKNSGEIVKRNGDVKASYSHELGAKAELTFHLMPRLAFGVTIPKADANVFAEIDTSVTAGLEFKRSKEHKVMKRQGRFAAIAGREISYADESVSTPAHDLERRGNRLGPNRGSIKLNQPSMARKAFDKVKSVASQSESKLSKTAPAVAAAKLATKVADVTGSEGCLYIKSATALNVGSTMNFFGLFDDDLDHKLELKKVEWPEYKRCTPKTDPKSVKAKDIEPPVLSSELAAVRSKSRVRRNLRFATSASQNTQKRAAGKTSMCQDPKLNPKSIASFLSETISYARS
ncbi:hypothetical protein HGRIS_011137 [Hohenbuehelia grisea]|uniref:Uncharacterized protein n=1 Tax=Hohenbuehelia grisea TaxID=104357 RepID=A0ABR3IZ75_9AGAR